MVPLVMVITAHIASLIAILWGLLLQHCSYNRTYVPFMLICMSRSSIKYTFVQLLRFPQLRVWEKHRASCHFSLQQYLVLQQFTYIVSTGLTAWTEAAETLVYRIHVVFKARQRQRAASIAYEIITNVNINVIRLIYFHCGITASFSNLQLTPSYMRQAIPSFPCKFYNLITLQLILCPTSTAVSFPWAHILLVQQTTGYMLQHCMTFQTRFISHSVDQKVLLRKK